MRKITVSIQVDAEKLRAIQFYVGGGRILRRKS